MNTLILAIGLFSLSSSSYAQNLCETLPGGLCKPECATTDTLYTGFGVLGCIMVPNAKCCQGEVTTTAEPTTTTEMPSTEPPTTTQSTTTGEPTTSTAPPPSTPPSTPPPAEQCGISNSAAITARIFGGAPTNQCDWPWMVAIRGKVTNADTIANATHSCSGVLIESNWVVTTAYCAIKASFLAGGDAKTNIFVVAGEHNIEGTDFLGTMDTEQYFGVEEIMIHENYTHTDISTFVFSFLVEGEEANNIALLKLDRHAVFNNCVRKVCLPDVPVAGVCPTLIKDCWSASWGSGPTEPNILNEAELTVVNADAWKAHAQLSGIDSTLKPLTLNGSFKNSSARACSDDSGGMVVCKKDDTSWVLEGLINRPNAYNCQAEGTTNNVLLTDITAAADWIRGKIAV